MKKHLFSFVLSLCLLPLISAFGEYAAPLLYRPADDSVITTDDVTLRWFFVDGYTSYQGYHIQVSLDSNFTQIVGFNQNVSYYQNYWKYTHLPKDGTRFYWRVKTEYDGTWSEVWSFVSAYDGYEPEGEGEPVEGEIEGEIEGEPVEGENEGEDVEGEPVEGEDEPNLDDILDNFDTLDINGDGVLSEEELEGVLTPNQFAALDTNGDGDLTSDELGGHIEPVEGENEGEPNEGETAEGEVEEEGEEAPLTIEEIRILLKDDFDDIDTDGDVKLSPEEALEAVPALKPGDFQLLDLNDDGFLSKEELQEPLDNEGEPVEEEGEPETTEEIVEVLINEFNDADTNGDNRLTYTEARGIVQGLTNAQFFEYDIDNDGYLEQDELEEILAGPSKKCGIFAGCDKAKTSSEMVGKFLGDWLLVGISLIVLASISSMKK